MRVQVNLNLNPHWLKVLVHIIVGVGSTIFIFLFKDFLLKICEIYVKMLLPLRNTTEQKSSLRGKMNIPPKYHY